MRGLVIQSVGAFFAITYILLGEEFDHYVQSLSFSPIWCGLKG